MESHFVFCHSFGGRKRSWKNPTYYNTYLVIYIYGLFFGFEVSVNFFFEITTVVLLFWPLSCIQLTLPQNSCSIGPFKILYSLSISVWDVSIYQWEIDFEPICFAIFAVSHCSRLTWVDSYLGDEFEPPIASNCYICPEKWMVKPSSGHISTQIIDGATEDHRKHLTTSFV